MSDIWAMEDNGRSFMTAGSYSNGDRLMVVEAWVTPSENGSTYVVVDEHQGEVITGWHVDFDQAKQVAAAHAHVWLQAKRLDSKPNWSYVGCKWCGCIVAAYVEDPNPKKRKDLGREVGKWIGDGLIVQRMLSEAVRVKWIGDECKHGPEPIEGQLRMFDSE